MTKFKKMPTQYPSPLPVANALSQVGIMLRLEGLIVLLIGIAVFASLGGNWWLFAALILAPDLFMLGYLISPSVGASSYNLGHTYLAPALLALIGWFIAPAILPIAAIWLAHIGMDRAIGYGLKYAGSFSATHLGTKKPHQSELPA